MSFFQNLSVRAKLYGLVALAVVTLGVVALVGRWGLDTLAATSAQLIHANERIILQQQADMMHDALRGDVFASVLAPDDAARAVVEADVVDHAKTIRESLASNQASAVAGDPSSDAIQAILPVLEKYIADSQRLVLLARQNPEAVKAELPAYQVTFGELEEGMATLTGLLEAEAKATQTDGVAAATRWLLISSIGAGVVLIGLGLTISRSITTRLGRVVEVLNAVADRDFTQRLDVDSQDELGQLAGALNRAVGAVSGALLEVREVSEGLARSATELTGTTDTIAAGAHQQAASLEETAASLEEITATVKQSSENASQASQLAASSRETAERGGGVVDKAISAMGQINDSSAKIADIIATIDEIAFQTNILALNAAVEAARAGDQGRGFAVVAEQVGHLSQRSAGAAKEIKALIQDSSRKVAGGTELVNKSGQSLSDIVLSVRRVTDIVGEMASAFREQSSGLDQVNTAIGQMDSVTRSNAQQTGQLTVTAGALAEHAERMRMVVGTFRLDLDEVVTDRTSRVSAPLARREARPAPRAAAPRPAPPKLAQAAPDTGNDERAFDAMDQAMRSPGRAEADSNAQEV